MHRLIIILVLILLSSEVYTQVDFKMVDSTSYALYLQKDWTGLIEFSEIALAENFDYYYLNMRIGIAYYETKQYESSINFFHKALLQDSQSQVAIEYLFWCNYLLGNLKDADFYYKKLSAERKENIDYTPLSYIDFIYIEGGNNFQKQGGDIGDIAYYNITLSSNLSHKLGLYMAYYQQNQESKFSKYTQRRFFANPIFKVGGGYELGLALNFTALKNDIHYSNSYTYSDTTDYIDDLSYTTTLGIGEEKQEGTQNTDAFYSELSISKTIQRWKIKPFVGFSYSTGITNLMFTDEGLENIRYYFNDVELESDTFPYVNEELANDTAKDFSYDFGLYVGYNISDKLGISLELHSDSLRISSIINVQYKLSNKWSLTATYLNKSNSELYYYSGSQYINYPDKMQRYGFLSDIKITKKLNMYIALQNDIIKLSDENINRSFTVLAGMKYKF